jgi:hypothetical protein
MQSIGLATLLNNAKASPIPVDLPPDRESGGVKLVGFAANSSSKDMHAGQIDACAQEPGP